MGILLGLGFCGGSLELEDKEENVEGGRVGKTLNPLHSGHLSLLSLGAWII